MDAGLKWIDVHNNILSIHYRITNTRKGGNYSDVLPLKAAQRDSISYLTSFVAQNLSCKQTQYRFIWSRSRALR